MQDACYRTSWIMDHGSCTPTFSGAVTILDLPCTFRTPGGRDDPVVVKGEEESSPGDGKFSIAVIDLIHQGGNYCPLLLFPEERELYPLGRKLGNAYPQEPYRLGEPDSSYYLTCGVVNIVAVINGVGEGELAGKSGEIAVADG